MSTGAGERYGMTGCVARTVLSMDVVALRFCVALPMAARYFVGSCDSFALWREIVVPMRLIFCDASLRESEPPCLTPVRQRLGWTDTQHPDRPLAGGS